MWRVSKVRIRWTCRLNVQNGETCKIHVESTQKSQHKFSSSNILVIQVVCGQSYMNVTNFFTQSVVTSLSTDFGFYNFCLFSPFEAQPFGKSLYHLQYAIHYTLLWTIDSAKKNVWNFEGFCNLKAFFNRMMVL